jgi:hypothetical protein
MFLCAILWSSSSSIIISTLHLITSLFRHRSRIIPLLFSVIEYTGNNVEINILLLEIFWNKNLSDQKMTIAIFFSAKRSLEIVAICCHTCEDIPEISNSFVEIVEKASSLSQSLSHTKESTQVNDQLHSLSPLNYCECLKRLINFEFRVKSHYC